jgi:urease accessory protein UreE
MLQAALLHSMICKHRPAHLQQVELLVQQATPARQVLAPHMEAVARSQLQQHEAAMASNG